jgi:hypothetical protein
VCAPVDDGTVRFRWGKGCADRHRFCCRLPSRSCFVLWSKKRSGYIWNVRETTVPPSVSVMVVMAWSWSMSVMFGGLRLCCGTGLLNRWRWVARAAGHKRTGFTYQVRPVRPAIPIGVFPLVRPGTDVRIVIRPSAVPNRRLSVGTAAGRIVASVAVPVLTRCFTIAGTLGRLGRVRYVAQPCVY